MAVYNEIQVGRFNRFLQKLLSMKGPASMNTLAPELMPVLGLFHGAENRYLEAWDRFGIIVSRTAAAANSSQFRLRNPAGSNVVVVVEAMDVGSAAVQSFIIQPGVGNPNLAVTVAANALDTRGRAASTAIFSHADLGIAATFVGARFASILANQSTSVIWDEGQEMPILPGSDLTITTTNTVQTDRLAMVWRERHLEDSERA